MTTLRPSGNGANRYGSCASTSSPWRQLELVDDPRAQQRQRVRARRRAHAGPQLLGHAAAARRSRAARGPRPKAGAGQVRGRDEPVVAGADHHGVDHGEAAYSRSMVGSWRRSAGSTRCCRPRAGPTPASPPVEPGDPGRFHALFGRDSLITSLQLLPARPGRGAGDAARARRAPGHARGSRDARGAGQDRPRVPPRRRRQLRADGLAGAGEFALLRHRRRHVVVPVLLAAIGDAALAAELGAAWRRGAGLARTALDARRRPGAHGPRRARRARRSRAGATRSTRPARPRRRRHPAPRRREPGRRWPTPTPRPSPWRRCARWRGSAASGVARAARTPCAARVTAPSGPDVDGDRGGRPPGAGRRLAARLAAVGGRARARRRRGRRRAPLRARHPHALRAAHALGSAHRRSAPTPTTAARSGRSTPGSAGPGCEPPAGAAEAESVRSGVLAALDRLGRAPELYAVGAGGPRRSRSRIGYRPGRSAPAGRSRTGGTGVPRRCSTSSRCAVSLRKIVRARTPDGSHVP